MTIVPWKQAEFYLSLLPLVGCVGRHSLGLRYAVGVFTCAPRRGSDPKRVRQPKFACPQVLCDVWVSTEERSIVKGGEVKPRGGKAKKALIQLAVRCVVQCTGQGERGGQPYVENV